MGLLLLFGIIGAITAVSVFVSNRASSFTSDQENALAFGAIWFGVIAAVAIVVAATIYLQSYANNIELQQRFTNINVFKQTVTFYTEKGVALPADKLKKSAELTDFKYQNYQKRLGYMITDLRHQIVKFNQVCIGKRLWGNSWLLRGLIVLPPPEYQPLDLH